MRVTPKNTNCGRPLECQPLNYPAFELCLPLGARLIYDGLGLRLEEATPLPDGFYGVVIVQNGCITELREAEAPGYTPPPCAPAPAPCDGEPGPATAVIISPLAENLLGFDMANRLLVQLFAENGDNIRITGAGTVQDPLKISAVVEPARVDFTSTTPEVVDVTGSDNSFTIAHLPAHDGAGPLVWGGFTFDRFGHVQEYHEPPAGTGPLTTIKSSSDANLKVTQESGVAVIDLPIQFQDRQVLIVGDLQVTIDAFGRVVGLEAAPEGALDFQAANHFCRLFEGTRTTFFHQFETTATGRLLFNYQGDLGVAQTGRGLAALPNAVQLNLNGHSMSGWAVPEGGQIAGFRALTSDAIAPGNHVFTVTLDNSISAPGLLEISLCR